MSEIEPGLDLHEWESRWSQVEEELAEDPQGGLVEACDLVEELLGLDFADDGLARAYGAAREVADRVEREGQADPGDVGMAIENLRLVRAAVRPGLTDDA